MFENGSNLIQGHFYSRADILLFQPINHSGRSTCASVWVFLPQAHFKAGSHFVSFMNMKHCIRETKGWKGVARYYTRHIVDFFGFPSFHQRPQWQQCLWQGLVVGEYNFLCLSDRKQALGKREKRATKTNNLPLQRHCKSYWLQHQIVQEQIVTYTKLLAVLNAWANKIEFIIDKFLPLFSLTEQPSSICRLP